MLEQIREYLERYKWPVLGMFAVVIISATLVFVHKKSAPADQSALGIGQLPQASATQAAPSSESTAQTASELLVDVKGAVKHPGVYTFTNTPRVNDVVAAAGGFTEKADQKSVNLAQKLVDEAVVYVATKDENVSVVETTTAQPSAGSAAESSTGTTGAEQVNLNTADETTLKSISGIGDKKAQDIITYRDEHGGFKSVDELANVSGIGDKTLEKLKPYVTVEP